MRMYYKGEEVNLSLMDMPLMVSGYKPGVISQYDKTNKDIIKWIKKFVKATNQGLVYIDFYKDGILLCAKPDKFKKYLNEIDNIESLSEKDRTILFGRFCGYPECCIKAYVKDNENNDSVCGSYLPFERYKKQCKQLKVNNLYEIEMYRKKNILFGGIISHIPCSPNCNETKKMLSKYIKIFKKYGFEITEKQKIYKREG